MEAHNSITEIHKLSMEIHDELWRLWVFVQKMSISVSVEVIHRTLVEYTRGWVGSCAADI